MSKPCYFFFDFISPYAYLAWFRLQAFSPQIPRTHSIIPVPVVFAAFLNTYGHKGPAEIPPKRVYIFKDAARTVHREGQALGLPPLRSPPSHPFNPLLSLRVATVLLTPPEGVKGDTGVPYKVVGDMFKAVWGGGGGVENPDNVRKILDQAGLDSQGIMAQAVTTENKELLRRNTDLSIKMGAFGVPTIVVDDEVFWGFDSLPNFESHMKGNKVNFAEALKEWSEVKPSASRT